MVLNLSAVDPAAGAGFSFTAAERSFSLSFDHSGKRLAAELQVCAHALIGTQLERPPPIVRRVLSRHSQVCRRPWTGTWWRRRLGGRPDSGSRQSTHRHQHRPHSQAPLTLGPGGGPARKTSMIVHDGPHRCCCCCPCPGTGPAVVGHRERGGRGCASRPSRWDRRGHDGRDRRPVRGCQSNATVRCGPQPRTLNPLGPVLSRLQWSGARLWLWLWLLYFTARCGCVHNILCNRRTAGAEPPSLGTTPRAPYRPHDAMQCEPIDLRPTQFIF